VRAPAHRWPDVDDDLARYLSDEVVAATGELVGPRRIGVVLHGSLVLGDWRAPVSDLDVLVVIDGPVAAADRAAVARGLGELAAARPAGTDLDVAVLTAAAAATPHHPVPVDVRAGAEREPALGGLAPELAADLAVARVLGVALHGPEPAEIIGEVARGDLLESVQAGFDAALSTGVFLPRPADGILTACRGLATINGAPGVVLSKEEAGEWALERMPMQHRPLVVWALAERRGEDPGDPPWSADDMVRFRIFCTGAAVRRRHGRRVPGLP